MKLEKVWPTGEGPETLENLSFILLRETLKILYGGVTRDGNMETLGTQKPLRLSAATTAASESSLLSLVTLSTC